MEGQGQMVVHLRRLYEVHDENELDEEVEPEGRAGKRRLRLGAVNRLWSTCRGRGPSGGSSSRVIRRGGRGSGSGSGKRTQDDQLRRRHSDRTFRRN